ncbi:2-oxoglutarate dehydrogenase subunit E1 [Marivirga tractuosa]|uniref:oxoglutarate dehydrogenase (succinyl-transferring) n=1 Tax=Marivirga tractuosa (strain ATCC 23168 / DSM 4126 / NBRC 15989 / NCIMB 1408 / VKM B-1430 / H-43) TaxID=643867 RepID=E4TRJ8_MARTH|nr:2-oxoglutarate dehydrogenase E1 component [Marivirga tractuosa]ADR21719.1 2-oxoglutarate dehydrogenase, E1 subunit [Marivirga tractuosa DSM 4126]BDD13823.1 2-oxoglutarate dehydrogenase subunit E1 [Marivirga tractuosa]
MDKYTYIANAHGNYIEELYQSYKNDPQSVDESWQKFFEGFEFSQKDFGGNGKAQETRVSSKETQVRNLIQAYRMRGHLKSKTNPVRDRRPHDARISLEEFGLKQEDLKEEFSIGQEIGLGKTSLKNIIEALDKIYVGSIGFEYMHIRDPKIVDWFIDKAESSKGDYQPKLEEKKRVLSKLNEAVVFENFLHTKFLGQKRFSLEGGENTIPFLDKVINRSSELGTKEVVIGMAHRGRLNVLANIMNKTYEQIFSEFEGSTDPDLTMGDGDVKYHMGYSSYLETSNGKKSYVKLTPNPSHLEAVNSVVLGYTRAQIDDEYGEDVNAALPILIHGDAAVAGQGIVYETTQMSLLEGYSTGGTVHLVINNQVGFTTDYDDARSSIYCTDIAKMIDAPVLHVNGDDAEAVNFAANLAVEYRNKFHKDIFIDLLCYRRHGHNESDEPKFTQPKLYNKIAKHPNPREVYVKKLTERGDLDNDSVKKLEKDFKKQLQDRLNEVKQKPLPYKPQKIEEEWEQLRRAKSDDFLESPDTSISQGLVEKIGKALTTLPKGFKPLKQIDKLLKERKKNFFDEKMLNWADAELLSYGSLLAEGNIVRMSGQDVKRGTFSHRHSYLFDAETNEPYCNLDHIEENQKEKFKIFNSLLSEFGVLGFEYGYAMATPNALVIWEAQFGDFANGAQVMIDQFITSAESKWQRMNGLVMLLPHGYEGQGPEHSNARPERFLQLAAEENLIVTNITTPANLFHMFRRQVKWEFRKPLVQFAPKSLLRHPKVISPIKEFTEGKFREIYEDDFVTNKNVKRVLLCTGKVYYDLLEKQQADERKDVAIIRIEQLHPFPMNQVDKALKKFKDPEVFWVQEEPSNMGYWTYMLRTIANKAGLQLISRKSSASPATGYAKVHKAEQEALVEKAFDTKK